MKLSSGREIQAYGGFLGIDESLSVGEGFDGEIDAARLNCPSHLHVDDWQSWTAEEKVDLANQMIARWEKYRERAQCPPAPGQ